MNWQPVPALWLSAQYSRAFIEADPGIDRDLAQSAPRNTFSLLARYDLGQGWAASTGVYRSGRMKWLSEGGITETFTRWNWQGHEVEAAVVGQNLGEDYHEFRDTNIFSRRVYGRPELGLVVAGFLKCGELPPDSIRCVCQLFGYNLATY